MILAPILAIALAATPPASSLAELRDAVRRAEPGDRVVLRSGTYEGSVYLEHIHGEEGRPITISGEDPDDPPVIRGRAEGLHLSASSWVTIENLDWTQILDRYDRAESFFFLDPPYVGCSDTTYAAWDLADVVRLRDRLRAMKGQWLVTLNDLPDIRKIFSGCRIKAIERHKGINGKAEDRVYREVVIRP